MQEPLEAQNKTHKSNETEHSRQDSDLHRKLDCFTRQMGRSAPSILNLIVSKRLQKKKRSQTMPKAVLALAKTNEDQKEYLARDTIENDDDVILEVPENAAPVDTIEDVENYVNVINAGDNEDDEDIGI